MKILLLLWATAICVAIFMIAWDLWHYRKNNRVDPDDEDF